MARVAIPYGYGSDSVRRQRAFTKTDLLKTKFLFRLLFLVAFMAILSLFYIWSRVQIVEYGYEINRLRIDNRVLMEEGKKLNVEISTLKSPQRIESLAQEKLGMTTPSKEQIIFVP